MLVWTVWPAVSVVVHYSASIFCANCVHNKLHFSLTQLHEPREKYNICALFSFIKRANNKLQIFIQIIQFCVLRIEDKKCAFSHCVKGKDEIQQIVIAKSKCNSTKTLDSATLIQFHHKSHWASKFLLFLTTRDVVLLLFQSSLVGGSWVVTKALDIIWKFSRSSGKV